MNVDATRDAQCILIELCSYLYGPDAAGILRDYQTEVSETTECEAVVLARWIGIVASRLTGLYIEVTL